MHEDDDLIVVDKPAGLLTAGLPGQDVDSVFRYIKVRVREQRKRRGTQVWIIHRLDKEASGLLVFAKTERAYGFLKEEFRTKRAHRLYAAVVEGEIGGAVGAGRRARDGGPDTSTVGVAGGVAARRLDQPLSGTIQNFVEDEQGLVRDVASPTAVKVRGGVGGGAGDAKLAVTLAGRRGGEGRTLLQVRLETGRRTRSACTCRGSGIRSWATTGTGATDPIERVCLHATELGPTPGERADDAVQQPDARAVSGARGRGSGRGPDVPVLRF